MTPYEIMLSESQERMLLVAEKGREDEVFAVFRKWGLDAVTIGRVTADGMLRVKDHGEVVAEIPNRALADEAPLYDRPHNVAAYRPAPLEAPPYSRTAAPDRPAAICCSSARVRAISAPSAGSGSSTITWSAPTPRGPRLRRRHRAHQGNGNVDRHVARRQSAVTVLSRPREGTKLIVAECCRNLSTAGALPVAATNNLNFGNPERPEIMAQLVESIEGMAEACQFFETPITGGNVSLYNETLGEGIFPTPVMGIVGLMKTGRPMPLHFQARRPNCDPARRLRRYCDPQHFGGTQYAKVILDDLWGLPPASIWTTRSASSRPFGDIVSEGLAESAHDLSDGGLALALAEASFGTNGIGARIEFDSDLASGFAVVPRRSIAHSDLHGAAGSSRTNCGRVPGAKHPGSALR